MAKEKVELVRMKRSTPLHPDGPTTADVHPLEVENFQAAGWGIAPETRKTDAGKEPNS
jgi:hypothetical protein